MDNTGTKPLMKPLCELDVKPYMTIDDWTPQTREKMAEIFNILLLHATHLNVEAIKYDHGTPKKEVALIDARNCMDYCEWFKENIINHL